MRRLFAAMDAAARAKTKDGELEVEGFKRDLRFHDMRHSAMTRYQDAGVRPKVITQLTGRQTIAMQQHYDNPPPEQIKAALSKVHAALNATTIKVA